MRLFDILIKIIFLVILDLLVCGCEHTIEPQSNTSINESLKIVPDQVNCNGLEGFAIKIAESTKCVPLTKSESLPDDVSLYSVDENGQMTLTVFTYKYVDDDGDMTEGSDTGDSDKTQILQELSYVLQIIPSDVISLGGYILFSQCYYVMNGDVSDELRYICEKTMRKNNRHSYLIRKSDGCMYDVTDRRLWFEKYFISPGGNVYIASTYPFAVYRIEDNGESIDFRQITQSMDDTPLDVVIDAYENLYLLNDSNECEVYTSMGAYTRISIPPGEYLADEKKWRRCWVNVDSDNPENIVLESVLYELEDLHYEIANTQEFVLSGWDFVSEPNLKFGQYLVLKEIIGISASNCSLGNILEFQGWVFVPITVQWNLTLLFFNTNTEKETERQHSTSQTLLFLFNPRTGEYQIRTDYTFFRDNVERARSLRDKNFCYRVDATSETILGVDVIDPIKSTIEYKSFSDLPFMQNMLLTNWSRENKDGDAYIYINGKSTKDGTDISAWINVSTGEYDFSGNEDNREVITYFKIN